jgi:hypothetical protein
VPEFAGFEKERGAVAIEGITKPAGFPARLDPMFLWRIGVDRL